MTSPPGEDASPPDTAATDAEAAPDAAPASDAAPMTDVAPADGEPAADAAPAAEPATSPDAADSPTVPTDLTVVSGKWQMASIAHFFTAFGSALPLREVAPDDESSLWSPDVRAVTLERAIAEPDTAGVPPTALPDAFGALLLALRRVSRARARTHWYTSFLALALSRPRDFADCFRYGRCLLRAYDAPGFLFAAPWSLRLGALLNLCDVVAEDADCVREALRERAAAAAGAPAANPAGSGPLDEPRLAPFGRCSSRRFYYRVGVARIYSGFKRKGAGKVTVECSDADSMKALVERLDKSKHPKDAALASRIRDVFLPAVVEEETAERRRKNRLREIEELKMDDRHRKMLRPRRRRVMYSF